jgi:methylenetetrahydrofolate reductase (NADPH)
LRQLVEALTHPRYEVYPATGVAAEIAEHVPTDLKVTVTSSEGRGLGATLDLTEELAKLGYEVVPHLAARLVLDRVQLAEILDRLTQAGVHEAFVIAGDPREPLGEFPDAVSLLPAMRELGHGLTELGFVGYPEPHPFLSDDVLAQALRDKAQYATYVITQICFEPAPIDEWIAALRRDGVSLPVYVGIPGVVDEDRLERIAARIGARTPTRPTATDAEPGVYTPDSLVDGLGTLGDAEAGVRGFHVYTFNEVARTEAWRRAKLEQVRTRLGDKGATISAESR